MKVYLKKRSGKFIDSVELPDDCTVEDFKERFYKRYHYYPERQWWTVGQPQGQALRGEGPLTDFGVHNGETLFFKDLGEQQWKASYLLQLDDTQCRFGSALKLCARSGCALFEALNFKTHLILRGLRSRGTRQRGIPSGAGFDLVSCANYFWETLAWVTFAVLVSCFTAWLFVVVAFGQMAEWALKKHKNYLREFKDYPKYGSVPCRVGVLSPTSLKLQQCQGACDC
ncbi:hypothetical protein Emag_002449 [Eimeria magna]